MKYLKKSLCLLLCAVFALSFGAVAFAEEHVHSYKSTAVPATCTAEGYTVFVCECGDSYKDLYTDPLGHHYGGWDAVQKATCTSEGVLERTCIRCPSKQTQTVPMLDHRDSNADGKCDTCDLVMEKEEIFSPFDWFVSLFKTIFEKIRAFFAGFSK